jgi:hypothetical protein
MNGLAIWCFGQETTGRRLDPGRLVAVAEKLVGSGDKDTAT